MSRAIFIETSSALRTQCSEYLQSRGIDTYAARSLADARALLPALKPDVATLDPDFEDGDGLEIIEDIVRAGSRCLIISARGQAQDRMRALSLGADSYLVKPISSEELYLRLRNILTNRSPRRSELKSAIVDLQGVKVDLVTRAVLDRGGARGPDLSETELSLLRVLAENANRTVSKESLSHQVYRQSYLPGSRALDVGISRLRIKLKSAGTGAEIRSVREAGYLFTRDVSAPTGKVG